MAVDDVGRYAEDDWRPPRERRLSRKQIADAKRQARARRRGEDHTAYAERRACTDKAYFGTRHLAERYAELAAVKYAQLYERYADKAPKDLQPYRCEWCDGWHLTSSKQPTYAPTRTEVNDDGPTAQH